MLPLVFELQPLFAHVRGHVAGFSADELPHLGIGLVLNGEEQSALLPPSPDGNFELPHVTRGEGELFLVQDGNSPGGSLVLARLHVVIDRDLEGLVLAPDPDSLPERPERRDQ